MLKKVQVVMLPTNEKSSMYLSVSNELFNYKQTYEHSEGFGRHLYFLSDEEIKEGDWTLHSLDSKPTKCDSTFQNSKALKNVGYKKIITTTDSSLRTDGDFDIHEIPSKVPLSKSLPQPSQSFLEVFVREYNKGNVIKEVMVEYEEDFSARCLEDNGVCNCKGDNDKCEKTYNYKLKVNPKDNTITIKRVKDSWSREELSVFTNKEGGNHLRFIYERMKNVHKENQNYDYMLKFEEIVKWIEQNLT